MRTTDGGTEDRAMITYFRGYLLGELRAYPGWDGGAGLPDDTVVYLRDDLTVVTSPVATGQGVLRAPGGPRWREFCLSVLRFEVPER